MATSLLSPAQILQIKKALEDVTFTFHKVSITYQLRTSTFDRFMEDVFQYTDYTLLCAVEYTSSDDTINKELGQSDRKEATLTFNSIDLMTASLFNTTTAKFNSENDYVILEGEKYKVKKVYYDGYFDNVPVLCKVLVERIMQDS